MQRVKRWLLTVNRVLPWRSLDRWLTYSERRRLLDRTLEEQREWMRGRVLEIGAGQRGRRGRFVPPNEGVDFWWTVDLSRANSPHVSADVTRLPFPARTFETVVCMEVFEYVPDLHEALKEVTRVSVDESSLILAIPFMHHVDRPTDRWRLTVSGLRELVEEVGYAVESLDQQGATLLVMAHILKFPAQVIRANALRWLVTTFIWPWVMALRALDEPAAQWMPLLRHYSTGYLVRARLVQHPKS